MISAKLVAPRQFEQFDLPIPEIKKGELLVAIQSVGICASDLHYYKDGRIGDQLCVYPHTLGHECSGVVVKAFSGSSFKEGDRVAVEPGLSCGVCEFCQSGHENLCPKVKFLGGPGMTGAFDEFLALDERQVERIPPEMTFDEAALLEPLGVAYHAVGLSGLKKGETIAVFGAGAIGQMTAALAKMYGAGEAFVFDREQSRLAFAKNNYGFDHCVSTSEAGPIAYIGEHTNGRGVDVVFEAAGEQETVSWSYEAARIGGRVLLIGIPSIDRIAYDPHLLRRREMLVRNVRRSNRALPPCIELVREKKIDIAPFGTHHFPLSKISEAFETVEHYADGVMRAMVEF